MEKDQDPPFPREPWQRLLQDRADAPPETTDARIRARAQKAVAPRAARWWLPASLAASFLLAVLVVQWQYGNHEKPAVVTEADLAGPAASQAPAAADASGLTRDRDAESAAAELKESATSELHYEMTPEDFAPEPEAGSDEEQTPASGARIRGPEQELKAASEIEAEASDAAAPPPVPEVAWEGPTTATTAAPTEAPQAAPARGNVAGSITDKSAAKQRTPEAWYAAIEALRKAGRIEEADEELARFEAAYPDWLKERGLRKP